MLTCMSEFFGWVSMINVRSLRCVCNNVVAPLWLFVCFVVGNFYSWRLQTLSELTKVRRKWNYAQVGLCASGDYAQVGLCASGDYVQVGLCASGDYAQVGLCASGIMLKSNRAQIELCAIGIMRKLNYE